MYISAAVNQQNRSNISPPNYFLYICSPVIDKTPNRNEQQKHIYA